MRVFNGEGQPQNAAGKIDVMTEERRLAGRRVAVTGATGFVGWYVSRELKAAGANVVAVVERGREVSRLGPLDVAETVVFDSDGDAAHGLAAVVRGTAAEFVVHLHAAVSSVREVAAVGKMVEANVLPSIALMTACLEMGVGRLVLLGSGEEFGPGTGRFDDRSAADPVSPYGASKAAVTAFARMYSTAFGLPITVLRPAVVYGPGQAPRMLIPQVMRALREGREVPTTAGEQTRDFIHVEDVARGIVASLTAGGSVRIDGRTWNLGTGEVVTVRTCLEAMERVTGTHGLVRYGALPYRVGELMRYEPEVETTLRALDWRPRFSLEDGLRHTWQSLR